MIKIFCFPYNLNIWKVVNTWARVYNEEYILDSETLAFAFGEMSA